jgi:hypothetical protein
VLPSDAAAADAALVDQFMRLIQTEAVREAVLAAGSYTELVAAVRTAGPTT